MNRLWHVPNGLHDASWRQSHALRVASTVTRTGYTPKPVNPADGVSGFTPVDHRGIDFYYMLEDRDHGQQFLSVGDDIYWYVDPSTWATAALDRSKP